MKKYSLLAIFLSLSFICLLSATFINAQESPYFYSCILTTVSPSPGITENLTPAESITLTTVPSPTPTSYPTCLLKMGSGQQSKADLVILAEDYNNYGDFLAAVDKAITAINRTNLGAERLGKINIWALMDLSQTYFQGFNCPTAGGQTVACWDHTKAFNTAISRCGGDAYAVFNNDTHKTGSVGGISIWGGTYIYNFALNEQTFPHELGHSMAGLMDEYSFGIAAPPGQPDGVNCTATGSPNETTPCPAWAGRFPNTGCFQRCGYTNFYRPAIRSIMDRGGTGAVYDFNEPSLVDGWDEVLKFFQ